MKVCITAPARYQARRLDEKLAVDGREAFCLAPWALAGFRGVDRTVLQLKLDYQRGLDALIRNYDSDPGAVVSKKERNNEP